MGRNATEVNMHEFTTKLVDENLTCPKDKIFLSMTGCLARMLDALQVNGGGCSTVLLYASENNFNETANLSWAMF